MVPGYYGTPSPDSDVDILVVMETALRPVEQAVLIRQEIDFPFPVDLLVRTPKHPPRRPPAGRVHRPGEAVRSMQFGLKMKAPGYNIYVAGSPRHRPHHLAGFVSDDPGIAKEPVRYPSHRPLESI